MDGDDSCTTVWLNLIPLTVHLKMVTMVNFMWCVFYHKKYENILETGVNLIASQQNFSEEVNWHFPS